MKPAPALAFLSATLILCSATQTRWRCRSLVQMDAKTYPSRETPKSRRTRARILNAAMRLFADVGYHAATNGMIADAAKLTRGAMLYHFASREGAGRGRHRPHRGRAGASVRGGRGPPARDRRRRGRAGHRRLLGPAARTLLHRLRRTGGRRPHRPDAARTPGASPERLRPRPGRRQVPGARPGRRRRALPDQPRPGRFLLEGLARGSLTYDQEARRERLLKVVKRAVRMLNRKGGVQELWPE